MNAIVIDASVAMRWVFRDEMDRDGALRIADALAAGAVDATGPPNFLLEVAAALAMGIRLGRIDRERADEALAALSMVSITEDEPHGFASAAYRLALETGIRVPDAAYVEIARRTGRTLVSADRPQLRAASSLGLTATPIAEVGPRAPDEP